MLCYPFHSLLRGIAVEDVWHDNTECPVGRSLRLEERMQGLGSIAKHCPFCELLNKALLDRQCKGG